MDRQIGAFEILPEPGTATGFHRLGEGTFGITYKARHRLGHEVALKMLKFDQHDPKAQRFENEAKVLYTLRHPHIASFLHYDIHKGFPYCCMEFCGGGNLQSIAHEKGGLSAPALLAIGKQVCSALAYAHSRPSGGVIHRDIKPENLMLGITDDGVTGVKIIDFGLAKIYKDEVSSDASVIHSSEGFKGTSLFASPEQWRETIVDGKADLYSLGMTLWYLACGGKPPAFEGKRLAEVSALHLSQDAFDLSGLDACIQPIIARLLAKKPEQRFSDASQAQEIFAAALDALGEGRAEADLATLAREPESPRQQPPELLSQSPGTFAASGYVLQQKWWDSSLGPVHGCLTPDGTESALLILEDGGQLRVSDLERTIHFQHTVQLERAAQNGTLPAALVAVSKLRWFADGVTVVELQPIWAVPLLEIMRHRRKLSFVESLLVLQHLAMAMDYLSEHRLPVPDLADSRLFLALADPAKLAEVSWLIDKELAHWPQFVLKVMPLGSGRASSEGDGEQPDLMATYDASEESAAFNGLARFAAKTYSLVGGHQVAQAAFFAPDAYSEIPGLSADGNAVLRNIIAAHGAVVASCRELLISLCRTEGVLPPDLLTAGTLVTNDMFRTRRQEHEPQPGLSSVDASLPTSSSLHTRPARRREEVSATSARKPVAGLRAMVGKLWVVAALAIVSLGGAMLWNAFPLNSRQTAVTAVAVPESPMSALPSPALARAPSSRPGETATPPPATPSSGAPAVSLSPTSQSGHSTVPPPPARVLTVPDDMPTIAAAIAKASEGATINIRGGEYRESVEISRPVTIVGSEKAEVVLIAPSDKVSALSVKNTKSVYLHRLILQHPGKELIPGKFPPVINAQYSEITLADCKVEGGAEDGILLTGEGMKAKLERTTVIRSANSGLLVERGALLEASNCRFELNGASALAVVYRGAEARLTECSFLTNGLGLDVNRGGVANVNLCSFSANEAGVSVDGAAAMATVESSKFLDNKKHGIHVQNGGTVKAINNIAKGNGERGISLEDASTGCILVSNTVTDNSLFGIYFLAHSKVSATIKANTCSGNGYNGIEVDGPVVLSLEGNVCIGNKQDGILIGNGASGALSGNRCQQNPRYGIALDGVSPSIAIGQNQTDGNGINDFFQQ